MFLAFLLSIAAAIALGTGFVHVGFALTDIYPRSVWDWYVVGVCFVLIIMTVPAAKQLGQWQADRDFAKIEQRIANNISTPLQ